ncbi:hypothetical protein Tco_1537145 [Tanacetum coccineum]
MTGSDGQGLTVYDDDYVVPAVQHRVRHRLEQTECVVENDADSDDDESPIEEKKEAVKATRPQGRYQRRDKGKHVHGYSTTDLEGILVKKVEDTPEPEPEPSVIRMNILS